MYAKDTAPSVKGNKKRKLKTKEDVSFVKNASKALSTQFYRHITSAAKETFKLHNDKVILTAMYVAVTFFLLRQVEEGSSVTIVHQGPNPSPEDIALWNNYHKDQRYVTEKFKPFDMLKACNSSTSFHAEVTATYVAVRCAHYLSFSLVH